MSQATDQYKAAVLRLDEARERIKVLEQALADIGMTPKEAKEGVDRSNAKTARIKVLEAENERLRESIAQPAGEAEPVTDFSAFEVAVKEYIDEYEMLGETEGGRDACYTPSESDKALLLDAFMGFDFSLYTTPPKAQPLTGEQIKAIRSLWGSDARPCRENDWTTGDTPLIRAVEAAHGIKEQK